MPQRPVVVIPGYFGSKLADARTGELLWVDLRSALTPSRVMECLRLDPEAPDRVVSVGILDEIAILPFISPDVFKRLGRFLMRSLKYPKDLVWMFHFDWRKTLEHGAARLEAFIATVLRETGHNEVDIVAHSYGGLVARVWMHTRGAGHVRKFITLGTPHKGMQKTFEAVCYGIDLVTFHRAITKPTSRTFPSAYELLPSDPEDGYFSWNRVNASPFQETDWLRVADDAPTRAFMERQLRNASERIQRLLPPRLPVESYLLYGTGRPTLTHASGSSGGMPKFQTTDDGDGMAPRLSAAGRGLTGAREVYRAAVPFAEHNFIFDDADIKGLLGAILVEGGLPEVLFHARFRDPNFYTPHAPNPLRVEVRDRLGRTLKNARVFLTVKDMGIRNQPVPLTDRGDFSLVLKLGHRDRPVRYQIEAEAPGFRETIRGRLVSRG